MAFESGSLRAHLLGDLTFKESTGVTKAPQLRGRGAQARVPSSPPPASDGFRISQVLQVQRAIKYKAERKKGRTVSASLIARQICAWPRLCTLDLDFVPLCVLTFSESNP
ncbi:hypothetical protein NDU88_001198 [Pleurodeles waltl]|uniref:Uncharacterized protein n=1 Tax=Pleurodeles waltl TaxID=8319 RepID=A0AAV7M7H7_PLEWA|nr:hypothetical protein NDU88_001198 [Pleurodeles waltl]